MVQKAGATDSEVNEKYLGWCLWFPSVHTLTRRLQLGVSHLILGFESHLSLTICLACMQCVLKLCAYILNMKTFLADTVV